MWRENGKIHTIFPEYLRYVKPKLYIYVYIYIYRERETRIDSCVISTDMKYHLYFCYVYANGINNWIMVLTYTQRERQREREREIKGERDTDQFVLRDMYVCMYVCMYV